MDKRFLGILGVIVIALIIIGVVLSGGGSSGGKGSTAQATHHVEGQGQAGVTLVEYGDYQCPICEEYYQPLKQVVSQFNKQIYFQFRNLPLSPDPHPNAFAAARAAEAASMQGKFWQMHDKLYENQDQWAGASNPQSYYDTYAKQLGLNVSKFNQDYDSSQVNDAINADLAAFAKTGKEKATPTFFLDGKYLDNTKVADPSTGLPSVDKFTQVLNAEIAAKTHKKNT